MIVQILSDGGDQFGHAREAATTDSLVGDLAEPTLHHVQPGTRSRDEVQLESWMSLEPRFHMRVLVGRVIVHDDVQIEFGRGFDIDLLEETGELLMPMARHAVLDHLAVEHAEGRKQGRRAVAFVVVRHRPAAALLHRKPGLGAIKGLHLTFLVDAQHKGPVRGIQIQSDHIVELLDKPRVPAELEGLDKMGLEAMSIPDALDSHSTDALHLGHGPCAPMRGGLGSRVERGLDDRPNLAFRNTWDTTGTRSILFQPGQSEGQESFSPELDRWSGDVQFPRDMQTGYALRRHTDNLRPLDQAQRNASALRPGGEGGSLLRRQENRRHVSHATRIAYVATHCQANYGTLH